MARPRGDIQPRLLAAGRERFLAQGVDGASLRQIAAEAGTSLGMLYYYFPTKDDLFLAVVEQVYLGLLADLDAALAPGRPVRERLQALYARLGALSDDEGKVVRLVIREMLTSSERLGRLVERFRRGHVPLVLALVRDGFAEGVFDRDRNPMLVTALLALGGPAQVLMTVAQARLGLPVPPPGPERARALVDLLLGGVGPVSRSSGSRSPDR